MAENGTPLKIDIGSLKIFTPCIIAPANKVVNTVNENRIICSNEILDVLKIISSYKIAIKIIYYRYIFFASDLKDCAFLLLPY